MGAFLNRIVRDKNIGIFGQDFQVAIVAVGITTAGWAINGQGTFAFLKYP